ncbi:lambda exonuclease family protein [Sinorhizobium meliloti]|uniref:lambda exonuclease family protein n=1 Tax=Rhizobium meliloti TaxID=382 RepID=UPI000B4A239C|nr:lambda exonuclease family protein [Sinorhizobium meliloti]ASP51933.1 exonuclease [Sinorhizobium meliloti]
MDNIVQGTAEWHSLRLGKVTASRVADVIAKTKTGYSASRANYAAQLVTERLTGLPTEGFTNAAMQWGTDMEPEARAAYEFYRAEEVEQVAFVPHPTIGDAGASPDGLVGPDGLLEIKAPNTATHIATLKGEVISANYITQMQWQMACTGRKWCDFVSYDPRMPEWGRFFCKRVHRDDALIADLEKEVVSFLNEVRATVAELRRKYEPKSPLPAEELLMAG